MCMSVYVYSNAATVPSGGQARAWVRFSPTPRIPALARVCVCVAVLLLWQQPVSSGGQARARVRFSPSPRTPAPALTRTCMCV